MKQTEAVQGNLHSLGALQATYRDRPLQWRDVFLTFIPGCLAVLTPLVYGLWQRYYGAIKYGQAASNQWSKPWILLAGIALIPLLILVILRIRRDFRNIRFYEHGVHLRLGFLHNQILTWDQIKGINTRTVREKFLSMPFRTHQQTILYLVDEQIIRLDDEFKNLSEITYRLKAKIYPKQLTRSREIYHTDQLITFGPLTLSRKYIYIGKRKIALKNIDIIAIRAGHLLIATKNNHQERISISEIPNLEILLQLIDEGMNG